jgi:hypothetical protein
MRRFFTTRLVFLRRFPAEAFTVPSNPNKLRIAREAFSDAVSGATFTTVVGEVRPLGELAVEDGLLVAGNPARPDSAIDWLNDPGILLAVAIYIDSQ